jgi:hypothetical protein
MVQLRKRGESKALDSPPLNRAILEPKKKKSRRRKPLKGGKLWLELK